MLKALSGVNFGRDFTASIVVFLVAMPLCMGIAVASGVPPEKGLITGIIGGIIVGLFAGSPLQVSGPAAGLAVIVFEIVREQGLSALGPILILAGAIQVVAGIARVGGWFRAISPAVVHGMLAGIGVLIVVGQFHVLFDDKPLSSGLHNLIAMPGQIFGLTNQDAATAFMVGLVTIFAMLGWEKFRPASMKLLPGALVGVVAATLVAFFFSLPVARVAVPESIVAAVTLPEQGLVAQLMNPAILTTAIAIAFIASAETLLSAAAVDRMHNGVRTNYNKELSAQGIGNLLCGFAGALPMTGVIVRSSANVQAGATSRLSTILHGFWILGFVALLPWLLREIPMAALAGVLVITGVRLVSLSHVKHLFHLYGPLPAIVWAATLICVVTTDLLTGVLVGIGLSLLELLPHARRLGLDVQQADRGEAQEVALQGSATFLSLPGLSAKLESLPAKGLIILNVERLAHIDHTCAEMLREWVSRRRGAGEPVELFGATGRLRQIVA
ncbi:SulP family inorganic anion transporter [Sphingobium amiense]|uniref:SulP family inorganic anion transporter n=1 Tax=Sphingobium amiense TaxID=135719 RepID=A0A494W5T0_9SPHN|nr:SulP family inorganic anion transporter [Sphingobium amiense]BBD98538.1 SulP family inorganic anion transporter [Sphingobium amiense]